MCIRDRRSSNPVRFSQSVIDSLQNSSEVRTFSSNRMIRTLQRFLLRLERSKSAGQLTTNSSSQTDSTRARNQELLIQNRVAAELERLRDQEVARVRSLTADLTPTSASDPNTQPSSSSDTSPSSSQSTTEAIKDKLASALPGTKTTDDHARQRSSDSVSKEISALKSKLEKRRKLEKEDEGVERAKGELVACLRTHDRRPLDCWREVEGFKAEVARLERGFVERAGR